MYRRYSIAAWPLILSILVIGIDAAFANSESGDSVEGMLILFDFVTAVVKRWGVLVTGGVTIGIISIWQSTGHPVAHRVYWLVAIIGLLVALYRVWFDERKSVVDLRAKLEDESTRLRLEADHSMRLLAEISALRARSDNENQKELVEAVTLLHSMKIDVMYWKEITKDKWGMAPPTVKLLPETWTSVVYAAKKVSSDLRMKVDQLESQLAEANSLIAQFLNMRVDYRDQRLMQRAYSILDQAAPYLFSVTSEFEAIDKSAPR